MSSRKDGKDDLKSMLMSFRIAELQTLLASCGRSRSGRKHELLGRAISLLKSSENNAMRERVKTRILELYNQRYPSGGSPMQSSSYSQPYLQYPPEKDEEPTYLNRTNIYKHSHGSGSESNYNSHHGHSSSSSRYDSHTSIHPPTQSSMPIHPDVKFINLPFFNCLDVLVKPTSLVQKTIIGYQDSHIVFHLTPYQTQLIQSSRSYNIKSMIEYTVQVQLRFCLAEVSCVQEDLYPSRCKLMINGKGCTLPGQPPPNAQNQEPRKPHRPINITTFCRLSPMQSNQIHIQWMPSDMGQRFATTVHLVKVVHTESLIQQLRAKQERPAAHTIAFIKEKLRPDPDSEIALTSLKVSLCCPIGRTRMMLPCRAINCNHLQCFDGSLYIQMNERKPSWVCPVCDQKAHYDHLFKDGMFSDILKNSPECEEIMFFEDGSWRPAGEIEDNTKPLSQIVRTPAKPISSSTVIDSKTPPIPLIIKTPTSNHTQKEVPSNPDLDSPVMPQLERAPFQDAPSSRSDQANDEDEEVEVITIDDSDSEDGVPTRNLQSTMIKPVNIGHPVGRYMPGGPPALTFQDPDLQGLDLYNILPYEDRIAAAMHLDQNNYCANLVSGGNTRNSPSSIIDISDE